MVPDLDAETREAELGYLVTPEHRGRGVATAIVRALTDWAFARGAQRVFLVIDVENPASSRVAAKAGFTREGLMRSIELKQGRRIDAELWSRLPSDP
jgi:RimJ/RimL family protein N-acetyltransferase